MAAKSHCADERVSIQGREIERRLCVARSSGHGRDVVVIEGNLRIDFRDGSVHIGKGEMYVVPKGIEHKPYAENEVHLLLIEPRGVTNTGTEGGERTAANDVWI
jgi:hypothetical protein